MPTTEAKLAGKTALVTGAARGIGRGIALEVARAGANVVVNDLIEATTVVEEIAALGGRAIAVPADVGDRAQVERLFANACEAFGRVDIAVANAVLSVRKPFLDLEVEDVERTWRTSLWGVFHTMQVAARGMAKSGGGVLIAISSVHSFRPYPKSSPYNGAKAAVNQLMASWALELAPYGIRANVLEPGWVDTPGERTFYSEAELEAAGHQLLFGRLARAEEIGKGVVFLASEDSAYMTGSVLRMDGGYILEH